MEDVTYPEGLAKKYFTMFSEEVTLKALKNPLCISRNKFTELCSGSSQKVESVWQLPN
jgi:hypothetical protein